jgi:hypothetical protein
MPFIHSTFHRWELDRPYCTPKADQGQAGRLSDDAMVYLDEWLRDYIYGRVRA